MWKFCMYSYYHWWATALQICKTDFSTRSVSPGTLTNTGHACWCNRVQEPINYKTPDSRIKVTKSKEQSTKGFIYIKGELELAKPQWAN